MDVLKLVDSLDSLWFFSNVFTSSTMEEQQVDVDVDDNDDLATLTPQEEPEKEESNEIEQNNETPDGENPARIIMCNNCEDFAAEIESVKEKVEEKKKMRRAARRRRTNSRRRRVFGELDLGFYRQMKSPSPNDESPPWLLDDFQTTFEFRAQHYMKKMPPLDDGLAMKQHLKSWAYAVACTVR